MAVDPTHPNVLVAGAGDNFFGLSAYSSIDGRMYWSGVDSTALIDTAACVDGDPAVAVSPEGRQYIGFLAETPCGSRPRVYVATRASGRSKVATGETSSCTFETGNQRRQTRTRRQTAFISAPTSSSRPTFHSPSNGATSTGIPSRAAETVRRPESDSVARREAAPAFHGIRDVFEHRAERFAGDLHRRLRSPSPPCSWRSQRGRRDSGRAVNPRISSGPPRRSIPRPDCSGFVTTTRAGTTRGGRRRTRALLRPTDAGGSARSASRPSRPTNRVHRQHGSSSAITKASRWRAVWLIRSGPTHVSCRGNSRRSSQLELSSGSRPFSSARLRMRPSRGGACAPQRCTSPGRGVRTEACPSMPRVSHSTSGSPAGLRGAVTIPACRSSRSRSSIPASA